LSNFFEVGAKFQDIIIIPARTVSQKIKLFYNDNKNYFFRRFAAKNGCHEGAKAQNKNA